MGVIANRYPSLYDIDKYITKGWEYQLTLENIAIGYNMSSFGYNMGNYITTLHRYLICMDVNEVDY